MESTSTKTPKRPLHNRVNRSELKERMRQSHEQRVTLSYYKYARIEDPQAFRDQLFRQYNDLGVLANEAGRFRTAAAALKVASDLVDEGIKKFHFYTLNRADLVYAICRVLGVREPPRKLKKKEADQ